MEDTSKYLIHAKLTADGIVERSDVVGAVFGQTEGLLGDEFDLRGLQQSSKVGRIDVRVESEGGQSFGDITIASSLDKVETAILAASLETISRVGPCEARVTVDNIEDVRAAKRRIVVERAKELLAESFEESVLTSDELHEEVRESVRAGDITRFEGLPAGPNVAASDAIVVVEGRADVVRLLKYGIKNAIAVEGTNVPDAVAALTEDRTVTAFFDGDRGGELILRELAQVGDVDYVAFAPEGRSVEDLSHPEVLSALREKTPYEVYAEARAAGDAETAQSVAATDGSAKPAPEGDDAHPRTASSASTETPTARGGDAESDPEEFEAPPDGVGDADEGGFEAGTDAELVESVRESLATDVEAAAVERDAAATDPTEGETSAFARSDPADGVGGDVGAATDEQPGSDGASVADSEPTSKPEPEPESPVDEEADARESPDEAPGGTSLGDHVRDVVGGSTGRALLLDRELDVLAEADAEGAFEAVESSDDAYALVYDGELPQRVLDVAAQRGLEHVVARETGEFVKQPVSPRIRLADGFLD